MLKTLELNADIPEYVLEVLHTLEVAGHEAFICGGAVRDLIIGRWPKDWDIATSALPTQVEKLFPNSAPTGKDYGTITVLLDIDKVEVTTYRFDGESVDGRRPKSVTYSTNVVDDVIRRDSTMNALLLDSSGTVYDYVGGLGDIDLKIVRAVGDGFERIKQDKLRILRYVRQAVQLNFNIETYTFAAIRSQADLSSCVAGSALWMELSKILESKYCGRGVRLLYDSGILKYILPEVYEMFGFDQQNPWHPYTLEDHSIRTMEMVPPAPLLRFCALIHDIGKITSQSFDKNRIAHYYRHHLDSEDMAREICSRLSFSNEDTSYVCILVREHANKYYDLGAPAIKRFIKRVGKEKLKDLFQLQFADSSTHTQPVFDSLRALFTFADRCFEVASREEPLHRKDLAINGKDLLDLGFSPGLEMGVTLDALVEHVIEFPEDNIKEVLLKRVLGSSHE